jgi:hypothetical protein
MRSTSKFVIPFFFLFMVARKGRASKNLVAGGKGGRATLLLVESS